MDHDWLYTTGPDVCILSITQNCVFHHSRLISRRLCVGLPRILHGELVVADREQLKSYYFGSRRQVWHVCICYWSG